MKIKEELDLTAIITTFGFIVAMIVWGIRLEGAVSSNTTAMNGNEEMRDKVQKVHLEGLEFQIDQLRQRISVLENQQRRDE